MDITFPDGSTPVLSTLCVYGGQSKDFDDASPPLVSEVYQQARCSKHYLEPVRLAAGQGLVFTGQGKVVRLQPPVDLSDASQQINFGDMAQDVVTEIGPPSDVFYKVQRVALDAGSL